ncbi:hypothetical protein [Psychroserpens algicola]|uniref:PsbP C-terminal domain-containing protein n=1 Tax=Psychroserpens algicola TaxID=1719034 RepID=A0ABT0HCT1_9FLAO|nr:hypothetical protein [Psychroserpens algicola]MCK8481675.1 hypothetical protein [Psychroserpens algicola]
MRRNFALLSLVFILCSCNKNTKQTKEDRYLNASYKTQKSKGILPEHSEEFDSLTNIYSNFKYHISFDAPDHWNTDHGTAKHTIFRGNDPELALTFSIVVVDLKTEQTHPTNAWEFYLKNKKKQDVELKNMVRTQFNSELQNYEATKGYIRNFVSAKHSYDVLVRSTDLEYVNHVINHQIYRGNYIYTVTAQMPKIVYDEQPDYFERLFNLVSFLPNSEQ